MHKAIMFDLDGTLLDTLTDLANSMNTVLVRNGLPSHEVESYKYFVGDGAEKLVRRALPPRMRDDETVHAFLKEYHDEYAKNWKMHTRPYDGIIDLIEALVARGMHLTVLSNKPHDFTLLCVKEFLSYNSFDIVLGHRSGTEPKPDPQGALAIAHELGLPPEEFLYLGDTGTDMKTANACGMYPVGVLWGFRTKEELLDNGARMLLKDPKDLLSIETVLT